MKFIEKTYSNMLQYAFIILNPFKKAIIKTQCNVHKFINIQALEILKNDNYINVYDFFKYHIVTLNEGTVWADQDFKSSCHMYNPYTKRGLYGRKSAMELATEYYHYAKQLWIKNDEYHSLFYLGAALHILQDMTVPQHANVRLLDNHKQYETFVKKTYQYIEKFKANEGAYILDSIQDYIRFNAKTALKVHKKFKNIKYDEGRFIKISNCILPLAQRTTAGCMVTFYEDVIKNKN